MRRCRYQGQQQAHLQHVLTAIAANIERLSRGRRPPSRTSWISMGSPGRGLGGPPETE
ncbi:hypothetical protein ACWHAO_05140 [Streptomyces albidoflavus]